MFPAPGLLVKCRYESCRRLAEDGVTNAQSMAIIGRENTPFDPGNFWVVGGGGAGTDGGRLSRAADARGGAAVLSSVGGDGAGGASQAAATVAEGAGGGQGGTTRGSGAGAGGVTGHRSRKLDGSLQHGVYQGAAG